MLLVALGASLLRNLLISKDPVRTGEEKRETSWEQAAIRADEIC